MLTTHLAVLAISLCLATPQAQDARAEAERLAKSGAHAEALKRFQAIVAADPGDVESRMWIGRLHLEMGNAGRAAAVFESIVATSPQNVEALVGLGRAHTATGRIREAGVALDRAESLAPDRIDVLRAQGALHAAAGRYSLALAYYGRAAVLEPTNEAIRQAADAVRAARAHRVELGYDLQHFNTDRDDTHTGTIEFNARLDDAVRVFVLGQTHRGFDDNENRGGGGFEWLASRRLWFRGGAMFASDTLELPELDAFGEVRFTEGRAQWGFEMRFADFDEVDLLIGGPRLSVKFNDRLTGYAAYDRGRTRVDFVASTTSDSLTLGLNTAVGQRGRAFFEYRHGIDRLDLLTIDRAFADDAETVSVGATLDVTPFVGIGGRYDHQSRPGDVTVQRGSGRLIFRF